MSAQNVIRLGLPADEIVERNSGGLEHRAIALTDLASSLYTVAETFAYDDAPVTAALVDHCRDLLTRVEHTYLDADGLLTDTRRCRACDGQGSYNRKAGESVTCDECGGTGAQRDES